jgi:ATP-dependent Clp protease ATP-binding subunit ClpC
MILFLDEAQLFFQEGTGAFDMSRILLPVLQNKRLKLITAWNPSDFQRLKSANSALATYLTPVVMNEPTQEDTFRIVEDAALMLEGQTKTIVTYEAVREAVRLSGQYMQELAYPGKAITLLEESTAYAQNRVVSAKTVQQTIEQSLGVKVGGVEAGGEEADVLLNLEDRIHERMVNQTQAVTAVANALRRARAGVGTTKRPIGSFLFMGPTGVGKTELARSLAATYFGDERNMIRLDMSEYQQPESVNRLLDTGAGGEGLLLAIRKQPFSVVLLDEIEKAYGGVLNLLLQLLDEGQLTDVNGSPASFRNAIIIVTSNAGSKDIIQRISNRQSLDDFERPLINQLIEQGVFRAELINRFDEIVLFRPLTEGELGQVAKLMLAEVNRNLATQNISVELTDAALASLVKQGYDPQFGSRPMRRVIQRTVEDVIAKRILQGQAAPGTKVLLDLPDLQPDPNAGTAALPPAPSPPSPLS